MNDCLTRKDKMDSKGLSSLKLCPIILVTLLILIPISGFHLS